MANKVTIYDIAKKLNITAATVSRALNDNPKISEATKKLVIETAKKMNYEPNKLARALKQGKSNIVGVVVPYINRNFFSTVIRGIEEELYPKGYQIIISQTHEMEDRELATIKNLLNAQVEGIIISLSNNSNSDAQYKQIVKKGIPLVFFDRKKDLKGVSSVVIDDFSGSYDSTIHLIEQGCKRIAYLAVDNNLELYKNRYEGYKKALQDKGLELNKKYTIKLQSRIEEGVIAAQKLMGLSLPPDGIVSSTDYGALGAIKWLTKNGYKIPDDVCVVGFSNEPFTEFMDPSISTVDQAPLEMGKNAARVFYEQANSSEKVKVEKKVILSPTLKIRKSSLKKRD